jgi:hypothetical protein
MWMGATALGVERNLELNIFIYAYRDYVAGYLLTGKGFANRISFRHQLSGLKDPTDLDPSGDRNWFFLTV